MENRTKLSELVNSLGWIVDQVICGAQSQYAGIRISTAGAAEAVGTSVTVRAPAGSTRIHQAPISISDRRGISRPRSGGQYYELVVSFRNWLPDRSSRC